jgi:hypothetical protein
MKSLAYKNDTSESSNIALTKSHSDSGTLLTELDIEHRSECLYSKPELSHLRFPCIFAAKNEDDKTALDIAKDAKHGPTIIRQYYKLILQVNHHFSYIYRLLLLADPIDQGGIYELKQLNWMARGFALMSILSVVKKNRIPNKITKSNELCGSTRHMNISGHWIWNRLYQHDNLFQKVILFL